MKSLLAITAFVLCQSSVFAAYSLPEYQKTQLENGLTIYLMEQKEVPLIDVSMVFNVGATEDGNVAGLATMTKPCHNDQALLQIMAR